jgi:hypothetical protein
MELQQPQDAHNLCCSFGPRIARLLGTAGSPCSKKSRPQGRARQAAKHSAWYGVWITSFSIQHGPVMWPAQAWCPLAAVGKQAIGPSLTGNCSSHTGNIVQHGDPASAGNMLLGNQRLSKLQSQQGFAMGRCL